MLRSARESFLKTAWRLGLYSPPDRALLDAIMKAFAARSDCERVLFVGVKHYNRHLPATFARHGNVVHHAAARHEDLTAAEVGSIDNLLDARDEGCEGSDHDTPVRVREDLFQRFANELFRRGIPLDLRVGG